MVDRGSGGGLGLGSLDKRPSALIRRYGSLYAQARIDTLDALEKLPQLSDCDELKSKLLFSVVVVSPSAGDEAAARDPSGDGAHVRNSVIT